MKHREGTCCSLPREFVQLVLVLTFGLRLHFGSRQVSGLVLRVLVRFIFLKLFMCLFLAEGFTFLSVVTSLYKREDHCLF